MTFQTPSKAEYFTASTLGRLIHVRGGVSSPLRCHRTLTNDRQEYYNSISFAAIFLFSGIRLNHFRPILLVDRKPFHCVFEPLRMGAYLRPLTFLSVPLVMPRHQRMTRLI